MYTPIVERLSQELAVVLSPFAYSRNARKIYNLINGFISYSGGQLRRAKATPEQIELHKTWVVAVAKTYGVRI
jgi:hypothetical protein